MRAKRKKEKASSRRQRVVSGCYMKALPGKAFHGVAPGIVMEEPEKALFAERSQGWEGVSSFSFFFFVVPAHRRVKPKMY